MCKFVVRVQAAPQTASVAVGAVIGDFDTRGEAEYFKSIAVRARSLRECDLVVAGVESESPTPWARLRLVDGVQH